jgi:hypothetical protein
MAASYNKCIFHSLTYGAECWTGVYQEPKLHVAQIMDINFLRRALSIQQSTPVCEIQIETRSYPIQASSYGQENAIILVGYPK